jgi:hypothetical protein
MKKETFRYYQVVAKNKVMVIDSHDVVDVIDQEFKKPCPHVTEIFKRVSGDYSSHKDKSEKKRILLAIKLFTRAFIVGTL